MTTGTQPGTGVTVEADGEIIRTYSLAHISAAGGELYATHMVAEYARLATPESGGTSLYVPASFSRDGWNYGFNLYLCWDVELPGGGDPGPGLLDAPLTGELVLRLPPDDRHYEAQGGALEVVFDSIAPTPDGVAIVGRYSATACMRDDADECVEARGTLDLLVPDQRREPGSPPPPRILL